MVELVLVIWGLFGFDIWDSLHASSVPWLRSAWRYSEVDKGLNGIVEGRRDRRASLAIDILEDWLGRSQ